jgi:sulfur-carrier protein adenylyltransferase/sulfurtransferase
VYSAAMSLSDIELNRYSRHLALTSFGMASQEKLKAAKVVVVGAGGLGSPALLYLAAAGVGELGIVEFDRVDLSNLQRQVLYDTAAVGKQKANEARHRLAALNPHLQITAYDQPLNEDNVMAILHNYDVVLDGTDQFAVRYLVNDACILLGKPLVSAAIHRFDGQAFTCVPGTSPCYRCLFPEPPDADAVPNCAEAGVLGVLPGVMGTIQATEAIKLVTGMGAPLLGRLLTYNALDMRFDEFAFARREDCAVCGTHASIHAPVMMRVACATEDDILSIDARALHTRLTQSAPPLLLDVREPYEFVAGHLPQAVNAPLQSLTQHLGSLPTDRDWIVMCRSGGRSARACTLLKQHAPGVTAINLQGGLLAWQTEVDQTLTVI